ncbi:T9SS type A sorting domain-containing protein [Flavobacterium sp. RHBU_24]|uniref:T9SS type A sorting domain-containing protein n=1 Tax=Flavobacterium sp. RHBU_24 TaxID=3391185 RepID=UPI003984DD61
MKQLLLSALFLLMSLASGAQATAYDVPDLMQCNNEVFDLTTQIPIALGNQDPENFEVTFFPSQVNATTGTNAIANPTTFIPQSWPQMLYLRVTNTGNGDFDITNFLVDMMQSESIMVPDVTVCDSYTIPALQFGNVYTLPNGQGAIVPAGTIIVSTQTLYVYYTNGSCSLEENFTVTINPTPESPPLPDVVVCGAYILPELPNPNAYYSTGPNGTGSAYFAGDIITTSQTLYVYIENGWCFNETSFTVTINGGGANIIMPNPLIGCDVNMTGYAAFDLTIAQAEFEANNPNILVAGFYTTQQDAVNDINPIGPFYANIVAGQQTIYLAATVGECVAALPLELVVIPCGTTSTLTGTVTLDADGNGCGVGDGPAAGIQVSYNYGNLVFNAYTDVNGNYTFTNVPEGVVSLWLQNINGQDFTALPDAVTVELPDGSTVNDFCISVPQPFTDVAAYFTPYSQAVPGFSAGYAITVVNYGTQTANGSVSFSYDNTLLSLSNAGGGIVSGNILAWGYSDLAPYQSLTYYVVFNVNTPPTVVSGTQLIFSVVASVSGATDVNSDNNAYVYSQYAVNSFDPNDIAVREGEFITEAQADGFLHYTIRFQNTGTANAQNVRVNLPLDENLDWSTFQPVTASHTFETNRAGGVVNFMFNNIMLPFEDADVAGSNGFVTFRIKPVADIALGDEMSETAYIYFDFNEAIVTNTVTTTVGALATEGFTKANAALYPNPASGIVNVKVNGVVAANASVTITDVLGKTVMNTPVKSENAAVNISGLTGGVYFVTVQNDATQSTQKLIIK